MRGCSCVVFLGGGVESGVKVRAFGDERRGKVVYGPASLSSLSGSRIEGRRCFVDVLEEEGDDDSSGCGDWAIVGKSFSDL